MCACTSANILMKLSRDFLFGAGAFTATKIAVISYYIRSPNPACESCGITRFHHICILDAAKIGVVALPKNDLPIGNNP
jgi:hypothetical protein